MFNKRKIAIVIFMAQIVVSSFAMKQVVYPKELFQELLMTQGVIKPDIGMSIREIKNESSYQPLFDAAKHTGLVSQYKQLLLTKSGVELLRSFTDPEILRMIAYMQNQYGQGNPFSYNGKGKDFFVELGTYESPNGTIIITRYSFFKGLLDTLTTLVTDQQSWFNPYFKQIYSNITNSLLTATTNSEAEVEVFKFSSLADKARKLIEARNKDAIMAIEANVIKPLERIVNQYSK